MRSQVLHYPMTGLTLLANLFVLLPALAAQDGTGGKSCNEFLVPKQTMRGKQIGQEACKVIETDFTYLGRRYRRMDMGITGTIDGYLAKEGRYSRYFGSNP